MSKFYRKGLSPLAKPERFSEANGAGGLNFILILGVNNNQ